MTKSVERALRSRESKMINLRSFWMNNLERALFARHVARLLKTDAEVAFAGAMLQDFLLPALTNAPPRDAATPARHWPVRPVPEGAAAPPLRYHRREAHSCPRSRCATRETSRSAKVASQSPPEAATKRERERPKRDGDRARKDDEKKRDRPKPDGDRARRGDEKERDRKRGEDEKGRRREKGDEGEKEGAAFE